jgi:hypothetical protein
MDVLTTRSASAYSNRSVSAFCGGVFVHTGGGGDGDRDARLFWQMGWDPSAITVEAEPVSPSHRDAFDITHFEGMADLLVDDHGAEMLLLADGPRQIQLQVGAGTLMKGPVRLHYSLAGFDNLAAQTQTIIRLNSFRRLHRFPKSLFPPERAAAKWLKALRAFDGMAAGASQRDIAGAVFGEEIVREQWNGRSDYLRARVQRLIQFARRMVDGGYRRLLG